MVLVGWFRGSLRCRKDKEYFHEYYKIEVGRERRLKPRQGERNPSTRG